MEQHALFKLLTALEKNLITPEHVLDQLKELPFSDMGFAKVDHHRALRTGHPEVIFCQGKTTEQVAAIVANQIKHEETILGTRACPELLKHLQEIHSDIEVNEIARCFWRRSKNWQPVSNVKGEIAVVSAGTADAPVAEEARCTLEILGHPCTSIHDVGVAGIHRLFAHRTLLQKASVIIVVAGMEGALPSVVAGVVDSPVIGVPTSVGYGAHLNGFVPLLAMLNSCASGLTVVNIDNGFGAAHAATAMNRL
jgi:hypothetical protein